MEALKIALAKIEVAEAAVELATAKFELAKARLAALEAEAALATTDATPATAATAELAAPEPAPATAALPSNDIPTEQELVQEIADNGGLARVPVLEAVGIERGKFIYSYTDEYSRRAVAAFKAFKQQLQEQGADTATRAAYSNMSATLKKVTNAEAAEICTGGDKHKLEAPSNILFNPNRSTFAN